VANPDRVLQNIQGLLFGEDEKGVIKMGSKIDRIDSALGGLYEGDVHLPVKRIWVWINRVETAIVLLMFAFAYGLMGFGSVMDRVDLVAVGLASLCVPTLILLGCKR